MDVLVLHILPFRWSVVYIPTLSQQEADLVCRILGLGDAASVTTVTVM